MQAVEIAALLAVKAPVTLLVTSRAAYENACSRDAGFVFHRLQGIHGSVIAQKTSSCRFAAISTRLHVCWESSC